MAILVNSRTRATDKNKWATTWDAFFDARYQFKRDTGKEIILDVAAEPQTAKVERYYLSPDWIDEQLVDANKFEFLQPKQEQEHNPNPQCVGFDALQCNWEDGWWCNPPFDLKFDFIKKATEEMFKGRDGMMLLPYEPLSGWWLDLVHGYASRVYEPNGRYAFFEADGRTKKHGVNFGSVLVLFSRRKLELPREQIIRGSGKALLDQGMLDNLPRRKQIYV